jgi:hypothetical protein
MSHPPTSAYVIRGSIPIRRRPLCARAPEGPGPRNPQTGTDDDAGSGYTERPAAFSPLTCHFKLLAVVSDQGKGALEVSGGGQEGVALKTPVPEFPTGAFTVEASLLG